MRGMTFYLALKKTSYTIKTKLDQFWKLWNMFYNFLKNNNMSADDWMDDGKDWGHIIPFFSTFTFSCHSVAHKAGIRICSELVYSASRDQKTLFWLHQSLPTSSWKVNQLLRRSSIATSAPVEEFSGAAPPQNHPQRTKQIFFLSLYCKQETFISDLRQVQAHAFVWSYLMGQW